MIVACALAAASAAAASGLTGFAGIIVPYVARLSRIAMVTPAARVGNVAGAVIDRYFRDPEPHLIDG